MRWCGPEVEVEGIVSLKTGGCPEDCHFCSQSGAVHLTGTRGLAGHPLAGRGGEADRGDRGDRVLHRGGGARAGRAADGPGRAKASRRSARRWTSTSPPRWACSPRTRSTNWSPSASTGTTTTWRRPARYFPQVVTTHTWQERWDTLRMVRDSGMEVCCGGILGLGESVEQRAEFAAQLAELDPDEVPLNFLNPRPGTPLADQPVVDAARRAAGDRRVPAGAAAHHSAVRRRPGDHAGRPGHPGRPARRHQRGHRR